METEQNRDSIVPAVRAGQVELSITVEIRGYEPNGAGAYRIGRPAQRHCGYRTQRERLRPNVCRRSRVGDLHIEIIELRCEIESAGWWHDWRPQQCVGTRIKHNAGRQCPGHAPYKRSYPAVCRKCLAVGDTHGCIGEGGGGDVWSAVGVGYVNREPQRSARNLPAVQIQLQHITTRRERRQVRVPVEGELVGVRSEPRDQRGAPCAIWCG